jgi:hypothetical protein
VARHPGPIGAFFCRIHKRKNFNIAAVATACKLVTIGFLMLKNNEPYRYSLPAPTQLKLSVFRVEATRIVYVLVVLLIGESQRMLTADESLSNVFS